MADVSVSFVKRAGNALSGIFSGIARAAGKVFGSAGSAMGKGAVNTAKGVKVVAGQTKALWIPTGIVAGVGALGLLASRLGGKRRYRPGQDLDHGEDDLASLEKTLTPMETGPAEGRSPNEWQNRVRPGVAPQVGAQPAMTAVDQASVQDLNTPPGRA